MKIDLFHNKIVKETITEGFIKSIEEVLLPALDVVMDEPSELLMYEDYLALDLMDEGMWHYPFIVTDAQGTHTVYVCWQVDKKHFGNTPYTYFGEEPIEFVLCDYVPDEILDKVEARVPVCNDASVKLNVTTTAPDPLVLVGKYSQSFVDEMARQLTHAIERAASVTGIADSPIELELVFSSGTYMEHTSEGVTYRRLLMVDGASRPRDFWVKWHAASGDTAYTVSDHVSEGEVIFEIGEDASQKMREKEYRFLCSSNPNKYQAAMGKRNVTEWRDLIKRAVRRGELTKTVSELEYLEKEYERETVSEDDELSEALLRAMGGAPLTTGDTVVVNDDFSMIDEMLRRVLGEDVKPSFAEDDEPIAFDLGGGLEVELNMEDEPEEVVAFAEPLPDTSITEEDAPILLVDDELTDTDEPLNVDLEEPLDENLEDTEKEQEATPDDEQSVSADEPVYEPVNLTEGEAIAPDTDEPEIIPEPILDTEEIIKSDTEIIDEPISTIDALIRDTTIPEEAEDEEVIVTKEIRIREDNDDYDRRLRDEARREYALREARLREEYEARERELRMREEELRRENERLEELARMSEERNRELTSRHEQFVEDSRATEEELRREIDARDRMEERERDRIAAAARQSIEEGQRRKLEPEAPPVPDPTPTPAPEREITPTTVDDEPDYMSKRVKIIFRSSIDFGVFGKIKSVIEETIIREDKAYVPIAMKAFPEGDNVVNINITRMPRSEEELLITIVKAIGNARIGVTKIILEEI